VTIGDVDAVVLPVPSWPSALSPQHEVWPAVEIAQVW
jgi:hypothetical protein